MNNIVGFCLIVGIGSTVALDVWVNIVRRLTGIKPTEWGMVGRWLLGLRTGQLILNVTNTNTPSTCEKAIGWLFHYLIGIAYAGLIVLIWGATYIDHPTVLPVIIVGLIFSSLAGLGILAPAMGSGFFALKKPYLIRSWSYVLIAHSVFALSQYAFSEVNRIL